MRTFIVSSRKNLRFRAKIKVAPRDELWGYLECVPLAGIEPATCNIVGALLYPLSYSGTHAGT